MLRPFRGLLPIAFVSAVLLVLLASAAEPPKREPTQSTPIERVTKNPRGVGDGLGTTKYAPSETERPFFDKLAEGERAVGSIIEDDAYDIRAKNGKYVGWFGIVREVAIDKAAGRTTLTVEHKYFDSLTDTHILALSFNGSGDFQVVLKGADAKIAPLSLIKVYGKVTDDKGQQVPRVDAVFVRNWDWGTFTFLSAYGKQRDSEKWRKLNKVELDDIYDPHPTTSYYKERLGPRPDEKDRSEQFRHRALKAAEAARPGAEAIIGPLIDAIVESDTQAIQDGIQQAATAHALSAIVAALAEALAHDEPEIRSAAAEQLQQLGCVASAAVPALLFAVKDSDQYVRNYSVEALGDIGPEAAVAVPALIAALKDESHYVRSSAADALGRIALHSDTVVPVLIERLSDEAEFVRSSAVDALQSYGAAARPALGKLIELLDADEESYARTFSARAIGAIDTSGKQSLLALIKAMKQRDPAVRRYAAMGVSCVGANGEAAVPILLALLKDPDVGARVAAAEALWKVNRNTKDTLPALKQVIDPPTGHPAAWALYALSAFGPDAKSLVPTIEQILHTKNDYVRSSAAFALGSIGPSASAALPSLDAALEDKDDSVRASAAEALWRINRDPRAIPQLVKELQGGPNRYPSTAVEALGRIGAPAKEAIAELKEVLLWNRNCPVRQAAARALKAIDDAPAESRPAECCHGDR